MSYENKLRAIFTEELRIKFFTYLHGYADNRILSYEVVIPSDFRYTRFWYRFGPITDLREAEISRQLYAWTVQFCEERNREPEA